jgi:hypothetical protein
MGGGIPPVPQHVFTVWRPASLSTGTILPSTLFAITQIVHSQGNYCVCMTILNGPFCLVINKQKSGDISVSIALGYGLYDRGSRVRFPTGVGNFSLHHRVQNGSGAHPASYPMGARGSFLGGKAAGA